MLTLIIRNSLVLIHLNLDACLGCKRRKLDSRGELLESNQISVPFQPVVVRVEIGSGDDVCNMNTLMFTQVSVYSS